MTLDQATLAVVEALAAEDLEATAAALELREQAVSRLIGEGATPSLEAIEAGERACLALTALKQRWALESARLSQHQAGFGSQATSTLDLRG